MKLISWDEWLDKHIPYYEADRHREIMRSDPPQSVLIVTPTDKITVSGAISALANHYANKKDYETISEQIVRFAKHRVEPLFLERDTKQCWYWAFWNENDALSLVIRIA
jgi:hypothetical protein